MNIVAQKYRYSWFQLFARRVKVTDECKQGVGMDRALAVQILKDVEKTVEQVVAAGYSLDVLTPAHIIMQVAPCSLFQCQPATAYTG